MSAYTHTFSSLVCAIGRPARSFSYAISGSPNYRDHTWRCGCGAREDERGLCLLEPCEAHAHLDPASTLRRELKAWALASRG